MKQGVATSVSYSGKPEETTRDRVVALTRMCVQLRWIDGRGSLDITRTPVSWASARKG